MRGSYQGSCLCGVVKFEIDEFLPQMTHCHCSMCRKFHGAAYATIAGVSRSKFRWVEGVYALKGYTANNGTTRTFCSRCGSSLMFASPYGSEAVVEIALGTLDGAIPVKPDPTFLWGRARTGLSGVMACLSMWKDATAPRCVDDIAIAWSVFNAHVSQDRQPGRLNQEQYANLHPRDARPPRPP